MKASWSFTGGLALGAGIMYLMDPSEGRRRRTHAPGESIPSLRGGTLRRGEAASWTHIAWPRPIQYLAGALGAVAVAYGAREAIRRAGGDENPAAPNYEYLR